MLPKGKVFLRGAEAYLSSWFGETPTKGFSQSVPTGLFVDADWLSANLEHPGLLVVQMGGAQFYPFLHIPGSVLMTKSDLMVDQGGLPGMRSPPEVLAARFGQLGIAPDQFVVAYDSEGGKEAGRLVWTLHSLGHTRAAVLDGGIAEWLRLQKPMTKNATPIVSRTFPIHLDPQWEITWEEVRTASLDANGPLLIDTRSAKEYQGEVWRPPRGHIPRALNMDWISTLVDPKDPRLRPRADLKATLATMGVTDPEREVIVYCQTGQRAAQFWTVMREMGFRRVRLYDGSIVDWAARGLPLVSGAEPV